MSDHCSDLIAFAHGELEPERADAFRSHLQTCAACQADLVTVMQLDARLSARAEQRMLPAEPAPAGAPIPIRAPRPRWRPSRVWWAGGVLAAAGLVVVIIRLITAPSSGSATLAASSAFGTLDARPYEIRLAYDPAATHRPVRDVMRGGTGTAAQPVPYAAIDALQRRGDLHGVAIARIWNGDKPSDIVEQLRRLAIASTSTSTPALRSDLAAVELLTTGADNIEPVLVELEALERSADLAVARAARWNHAILLAHLGLPFGAEQAFRAIAAEGEPGWAAEATVRAAAEARKGAAAQRAWEDASAAGLGLVASGTIAIDLVRRYPGMMRAYLYNAVRTAPSRARVLALAPIAAELDQLDDQPRLGDYIARIAARDFTRRGPVAAAYAQLLQGAPLDPTLHAALAAPTADSADIALGALIELETGADAHLERFRALAAQTRDPWFAIALARAEASHDLGRRDWLGAESQLRRANAALCSPAANRAINYPCLGLARQLGDLLQELHRVPEAITVLRRAIVIARRTGEWGRYRDLLFILADVERYHASLATARAYATEVQLMARKPGQPTTATERAAYVILTAIATREADGRGARRMLEAAIAGSPPGLAEANHFSDIGRFDPQPGDLARLQGWLGALRAGPLSASQRVFADVIEGKLLIQTDRAAGSALLDRAIAAADRQRDALAGDLAGDPLMRRARTGAFAALASDAVRHRALPRVLDLVARELRLPSPGPCTVAAVAADNRTVVVVRGNDGQDQADDRANNASGTVSVSPDLARGLRDCTHVRVLARPDLQGQPRILPADLPWSYVTGARDPATADSARPAPRNLVVMDVNPPAYLELPRLAVSGSAQSAAPSAVVLSGAEATPARVLTELRDATEVQFHTHALVDAGISDASHLVLSPGTDGNYALTAEALRGSDHRRNRLRGHPIVVLAACDSAHRAGYHHAPWSLPDAFLSVGARAVLATATEIPDREAGPFFDRVLGRIRGGTAPAAALREERVAALTANPASWAADVILFE